MAKAKKAQIVDPSEVLSSNSEDLKKYVRLAIIGAVVVVTASVGIGIVKKQNKKKIEEQATIVFQFKDGALKNFEDKKIKEEELIKSAEAAATQLSDTASFFPVSSTIFTKLRENKYDMSKLIPLFKTLQAGTSSKNLAYYYFSNYLAVIYEDAKNYGEALMVLKALVDSPYKYEEKLYLDLGRLSFLSNDQAGAKSNLNHVVEKFPDSDMAKMAKRYLAKYDLETTTNKEAKTDEE